MRCPKCKRRIGLVSYQATALYKIQKSGREILIDTDSQTGDGLGDYICENCDWRSSDIK